MEGLSISEVFAGFASIIVILVTAICVIAGVGFGVGALADSRSKLPSRILEFGLGGLLFGFGTQVMYQLSEPFKGIELFSLYSRVALVLGFVSLTVYCAMKRWPAHFEES